MEERKEGRKEGSLRDWMILYCTQSSQRIHSKIFYQKESSPNPLNQGLFSKTNSTLLHGSWNYTQNWNLELPLTTPSNHVDTAKTIILYFIYASTYPSVTNPTSPCTMIRNLPMWFQSTQTCSYYKSYYI